MLCSLTITFTPHLQHTFLLLLVQTTRIVSLVLSATVKTVCWVYALSVFLCRPADFTLAMNYRSKEKALVCSWVSLSHCQCAPLTYEVHFVFAARSCAFAVVLTLNINWAAAYSIKSRHDPKRWSLIEQVAFKYSRNALHKPEEHPDEGCC